MIKLNEKINKMYKYAPAIKMFVYYYTRAYNENR